MGVSRSIKNPGDGSAVTWGEEHWGGNSSSVSLQLASDVQQIYSTDDAFAALKLRQPFATVH